MSQSSLRSRPLRLSDQQKREYLHWDVETWGRAVDSWLAKLADKRLERGLEIGSRRGGLSSLFAREFSMQMVCSDFLPFDASIHSVHRNQGIADRVNYVRADGMALPLADESFDLVTFKSVLGDLGTLENQRRMVAEMYRVLRPGGTLCFAENLRGSVLHQVGRRWFRRWGAAWRYVTWREMQDFLSPFSEVCLKSTGFLSAFSSRPKLRGALAASDHALRAVTPRNWRYVVYGEAIK